MLKVCYNNTTVHYYYIYGTQYIFAYKGYKFYVKLTPLILDKPVLEFTHYLQLIIKRNVVCEKHCFVYVFFALV